MKKKRATLSIVLAVLLLPLITFFLVLFDFLRISHAKENIELVTNKALENALVEYDEDIYDKYRLMCISDMTKSEESFNASFQFFQEEDNGNFKLPSFKEKSITLEAGSPLSEAKAMKLAIVKRHEKFFVINSMENWMKKIEELKKLHPYAKACEAYSEAVSELTKLKKIYDKLETAYKDIESKEAEVLSLNVKICIDEIIEGEERLEVLREEVSDMKDEIRELEADIMGFDTTLSKSLKDIKDIIDTKKDAKKGAEKVKDKKEKPDKDEEKKAIEKAKVSKREEIDKLKDAVNQKNEEIRIIEGEVNENKAKKDTLIKRNNLIPGYSKAVSYFSEALDKAREKILIKEKELEILGSEIDISETQELVKNILEKIREAKSDVNGISSKLDGEAIRAEKQNRDIKTALNEKKAYEGETDVNDTEYGKLDNYESITGLLGSWDNTKPAVEIEGILDLIWMAINGELLPDFSDISEEDFSVSPYLASRDKASKTKKKDSYTRKEARPSKKDLANKTMEKSLKSTESLSSSSLNILAKNIFEKLVVADYIMETFSHYSFKDEDKGKFLAGAEVEYILSGFEHPTLNLSMTQLKIFTLRFCLNFVPIVMYQSDNIDAIAAWLSTSTAGLGFPIYKGIVILAWNTLESLADLKEINEGKGCVIIKGKDDIISSLNTDDLVVASAELISKKVTNKHLVGDDESKAPSGKLRMSYEEHLALFLILESEETSLLRVADLISLKEKADTRELYCGLKATVDYNIPLFFPKAKTKLHKGAKLDYDYSLTAISSY